MRKVIFYRLRDFEKYELKSAQNAGFFCTKHLTDIKAGDFVVPRYSTISYGVSELDYDITALGAKLINSPAQFRFISDLGNYVEVLNENEELTPKTWTEDQLAYLPENTQFFLKGETTAHKFLFDTHAFAANKKEAVEIFVKLKNDCYIGTQRIYIRKFVKFKKYLTGEHGLPIIDEYRFFIYNAKVIGSSYYWCNHLEDLAERGFEPDPKTVPTDFLNKIIELLAPFSNGFVVDLAQTEDGNWLVVECNALECSGPQGIDTNSLYTNLYNSIAI